MRACSPAREAAAPPSGWTERMRLSSDTSMPKPHWFRCTVHSNSTASPPSPPPGRPAMHEARRKISARLRARAGGAGGMGGWAGAGRCQLVALVSGLW